MIKTSNMTLIHSFINKNPLIEFIYSRFRISIFIDVYCYRVRSRRYIPKDLHSGTLDVNGTRGPLRARGSSDSPGLDIVDDFLLWVNALFLL